MASMEPPVYIKHLTLAQLLAQLAGQRLNTMCCDSRINSHLVLGAKLSLCEVATLNHGQSAEQRHHWRLPQHVPASHCIQLQTHKAHSRRSTVCKRRQLFHSESVSMCMTKRAHSNTVHGKHDHNCRVYFERRETTTVKWHLNQLKACNRAPVDTRIHSACTCTQYTPRLSQFTSSRQDTIEFHTKQGYTPTIPSISNYSYRTSCQLMELFCYNDMLVAINEIK